ncbi:MAG TPA: GIY-YIG nuclease family protein [Candidatus Solibacter sp.]|nr:GIY-YIG nuclease family protein [Candidatus Solibacter sp.]
MGSFQKADAQKFDPATVSRVAGGGIYALAVEKPSEDRGKYAIIYVGKTSDLKSRLQKHLNDPSFAGVTHFFTESIGDEAARADREKDLIRHFMPMGNTLADLPRANATEAAYLAVRALWHRRVLATEEVGILGIDKLGRVPETVRLAANNVLKAIAKAEGKPVEQFDPTTAGLYLNLLYATIRNISTADLGYDPSEGQRLLSELRRD